MRKRVFAAAVLALCLALLSGTALALDVAVGETLVSNPKGGEISKNYGTITYNSGAVFSNEGVIQNNETSSHESPRDGFVSENMAGGTIQSNMGHVELNYGTVQRNVGTGWNRVNRNFGTIETNTGDVGLNYPSGVVKENAAWSRIETNEGTVERNSGTVTLNSGTVKVNNSSGTVYSQDGGRVEQNSGQAWYELRRTDGGHTAWNGVSEESGVLYIREGCRITAEEGYILTRVEGENFTAARQADGSFIVESITAAPVALTAETEPAAARLEPEGGGGAVSLSKQELAEALQTTSGTYTLLADLELDKPLVIGDSVTARTCVLNLNGHTIRQTVSDNCIWISSKANGTIQGEGRIISQENNGLAVGGSAVLEGGTFIGGGKDFAGVVGVSDGSLSVTGGGVSIRGENGAYGLAVAESSRVRLSAGTYSGEGGAVVIYRSDSLTLGGLLYGEGPDGRCAYFDESGAPITGILDGTELPGPAVVKKCEHPESVSGYQQVTDAEKHRTLCSACGLLGAEADCQFRFTAVDGTAHEGVCACGRVKTEEHGWEYLQDQVGTTTTSTISRRCGDCALEEAAGEVTLTVGATVPYGQTKDAPLTCTAKLRDGYELRRGSGPAWQITSTTDWSTKEIPGDGLQGALPESLAAGLYMYRFEADLYDHGEKVYSYISNGAFSVDPAPLTAEMVTVDPETRTFDPAGGAPDAAVRHGERTLTPGTDYDVAFRPEEVKNAGTYQVMVTGKGNYAGTAEKTFVIEKARILLDGSDAGPGAARGTYGAKLSELAVSGPGVRLEDGSPVEGTWTLDGDAVPDVDDAGTYTARFVPNLGEENYSPTPLTHPVTLELRKAPYTGETELQLDAKYGTTKTVDLADRLPKGSTLGRPNIIGSGRIFDALPTLSGTKLTFMLGGELHVGYSGTVEIPVSCTNYEDFKLTVVITVLNKYAVTLEVPDIAITYGETPEIRGTASGGDGTANLPGEWSFLGDVPADVPGGEAVVEFRPGDGETYQSPVTKRIQLTIRPAPLSGAPAYTKVTEAGKTLADVTLTAPAGWPQGSFSWADGDGTAVEQGGTYSYTFTPDSGNYQPYTGSAAPWAKPSPPRVISVTGVRLDRSALTLKPGESALLTAEVIPSNATQSKAVTWTSGNPAAAAVDGGRVTALAPGGAEITVRTVSGGYTAVCAVTVTEPEGPEEPEEPEIKLEVRDGVSEVPPALRELEHLNTPEKIMAVMRTAVTRAGIPSGNTAVYDVTLMISEDGGRTWVPAGKENFPAGGLTVTLPYPEGTDSRFRFTVAHMFTTSDFGKTPGETERPAATNTEAGIQFTVTGLSPISVGWAKRSSGGGGGASSGESGSLARYAVAVERLEHGRVTSSCASAAGGSTVVLTVVPDSGYALDALTVTDSRGNGLRLTDRGGGKYAFTMPGRAVTVSARFVPLAGEASCDGGADCPSRGFTDLGGAGTWYHEAVDYVLRNGLMGGYGGGLFGPDDLLTRAQFVQILYNREGRPAASGGGVFADVAGGAWCAPAVSWAAERGVVGGYGDGRFDPGGGITREQLAVMLWRYAGSPAATGRELRFTDADKAGGYALEALRWAAENGIVSGRGDGILDPKGQATRAQAARMLRNFLEQQSPAGR